MNLATLRPRTQVFVAVAVPLCCLLAGLFVVWPAVSRWRAAGQELRTTQTTIQKTQLVIAQAEAAAQGRSLALAVALPSEQEPILFLRQFADLCQQSRVTLVSVRESTPTRSSAASPQASTQGSTTPKPSTSPGQLGGPTPVVAPAVDEVTDQVAAEGTFRDLLSLLVRMEGFERILSVGQCRITGTSSKYPQLRATFTLSRFVAKPASPTPEQSPGATTGAAVRAG